ncbi:unnamed protein product [Vitrella brassicaformis CCMP3155]|uniref:Uncharacterized protein n=1 Tax=Vitrella brassicaformis (strain CCMP3155) TaxID=1169540 RepID=A0A0G4FB03_VITBC|nr:unnamed protein product [Vitrella brassicaformis CCMP3155]|eukprot:CEM10102.1 unnamed protein product [Vitrella brassicaformis CCMP3155]
MAVVDEGAREREGELQRQLKAALAERKTMRRQIEMMDSQIQRMQHQQHIRRRQGESMALDEDGAKATGTQKLCRYLRKVQKDREQRLVIKPALASVKGSRDAVIEDVFWGVNSNEDGFTERGDFERYFVLRNSAVRQADFEAFKVNVDPSEALQRSCERRTRPTRVESTAAPRNSPSQRKPPSRESPTTVTPLATLPQKAAL